MKTSSNITAIAPALVKAQRTMQAAAKSATNPHFRSKYADLTAIIEATKVPLNEAEIVCIQGVTSDATGVMVETTLLHASGEWIADTIFLPVPQQTPQAYGSAITYGRRYGLQALVCLPAEDDDANKASEAPTGAPVLLSDGPPRKMKTSRFVEHCTAMGNATKLDTLKEALKVAVLEARAMGDAEAERSFIAKGAELKGVIEATIKYELASQP